MGKFRVYLGIDDVFIRNGVIELLESFEVAKTIKPLYFLRKLKDVPAGTFVVLIVDAQRAGKNLEQITALRKQCPGCTRTVMLITKVDYSPETDDKRSNFDFVVSGTDFSKMAQIFAEFKDEWVRTEGSAEALKPLKTKVKLPGAFEDDYFEGFTNTERKIIKLICQGLTSKQIADKLCKGKRTIDNIRYNLLAKTGTKNAAELAKFATETGIHRIS